MKKINCILFVLLFLIMGCSSNKKINEEQFPKEEIEDITIDENNEDDSKEHSQVVKEDESKENENIEKIPEENNEVESTEKVPEDENVTIEKEVSKYFKEVQMPSSLKVIPEQLKVPIEESGTLEYFYYDTKYYDKDNSDMRKYALVYLPYNYNPSKSYDIMYLMHGRDDSPEHFFGTIEEPSGTKYMLDHMIANGMKPIIIVACDYYPNNTQVFNGDGDASMTKNFGHEFINDLMPQVEAYYSTYTKGETTLEAFKETRYHRMFAGFSMGAVTTWYRMADSMPYCAYYLAMSGTLYWGSEVYTEGKNAATFIPSFLDNSIKDLGYSNKDFVMVATVGTKDFALKTMNANIEHLKKSKSFNFSDDSRFINSYYYVVENEPHDYNAAGDYLYNILPLYMEMIGDSCEAD